MGSHEHQEGSRCAEESKDKAHVQKVHVCHPLIETWEFPNLVVSNLVVCKFFVEALLCAPLRSLAPFCALLRTCVCALLRSYVDLRLRSFVLICVFLHPTALGTAEKLQISVPFSASNMS